MSEEKRTCKTCRMFSSHANYCRGHDSSQAEWDTCPDHETYQEMLAKHDPVGDSIKGAFEHIGEVLRLLDLAQDHSDDEQLRNRIKTILVAGNEFYTSIEDIQSSEETQEGK